MNPDLMAQLRDIHLAPEVSWWPPAPGWWILGFLLLVALFMLGRRLVAAYKIKRRRKQMLAWVEDLNASVDPERDPHAYLSTLNRIFKLVALRAFPDQRCAVMAGPEWEAFLRGKLKKADSTEALGVLATGPYNPAPQFDPGTISALACRWIRLYG